MSYTVYEENVIYDLKDYLDTNLDTYLTGIETELSDNIELTNIKKYEVGDKDIMSVNAYPAGLLFPGEVDYDALSVGSDLLTMQVALTLVIRGGKTENLILKTMRYVGAVRQCIDNDRTLGAKVERAAVVKVLFYARAPGDEDKMLVQLLIEIEKEIPR